MSSFSSLLKYRKGKSPAEAQAKAHDAFARTVSQSRLKLRSPGKPIPDTGRRFILGVATYSVPELELLDTVDKSLGRSEAEAFDVEVFDVSACKDMSDFAAFIPGIDTVYRTPIIGVLSGGKLIDHATGLPDVVSTLHRFHVLNDS